VCGISSTVSKKSKHLDFLEHMFVTDADGNVVITVPDIVSIVDTDTYTPLTNDQIRAGQNVVVMTIPCAEMWNIPEGYDCFRDILGKLGYKGERVTY